MHPHGRRAVGVRLALLTLLLGSPACTADGSPSARPEPPETVTPSVTSSPTLTRGTTASAPTTRAAGQAAAPVRRLSVSDAHGDVDAPRSRHWFDPSVDLTGFRVSAEPSRRLRLTFEFADLRRLEHQRDRFAHSITVHSDADGRSLYFQRSAIDGESLVSRTVAPMLHYGSTSRPCSGADVTVDLEADTVVLVVPVRCLARKARVARFLVSTNAMRVFEVRTGRNLGSDVVESEQRVRIR